ncbi:BamA/TamA family outer membrane protein [candidate division GN15 bacterium]|nr:BamA/TamA family outer membrane protein [candidate division GN15 bacterium]
MDSCQNYLQTPRPSLSRRTAPFPGCQPIARSSMHVVSVMEEMMIRDMKRHRILLSLTSLLVILLISIPQTTSAQYFGRNKVQYEDFDFQVIESEHFRVHNYTSEFDAADDMTRMAERWYYRFASLFDHQLKSGQPLILYANHADFQQTNVISGLISQGTGGVTEGLMNRVVLPMTAMYAEDNHVLGHELVHAFQYSLIDKYGQNRFAANQIPLWFVEGMAEYLSVGRNYPLTDMWLRDAVLHDDVPSISDMTGSYEYFPYRWGHAFWIYVTSRWGDQAVPILTRSVVRGQFNKALEGALEIDLDSLSTAWQASIRATYSPALEGRVEPERVGDSIITGEDQTNLGPSVSPDGQYVAVVSRQDLFSLSLYLVDTETGETVDELVETNTDAHFDALRFMNSSGAWSPDGDRFAFVVFKDGDNQIAVLDIESRDIISTSDITATDGITSLAWSPTDNRLVFVGNHGGVSDLFLYDLDSRSVEQLTDDKYAELQPSWSPDGSTIAFATDRGPGTNLETLTFGPTRLGLLDIRSGDIELVAIRDDVTHINPNYSPDGGSIYCIANPEAVPNIYRYELGSGAFYQVTDVATGISGLTTHSPALSVARNNGRLVFTVFNNRSHELYSLDAEAARGTPVEPTSGPEKPSVTLAPATFEGTVSEYLASEQAGLPATETYRETGYDPSLSLLYVGQPQIGVSVDRYGTSFGGGASFLFSDLLGNRLLGVVAQVNGGIKDLGGQVFYQNRNDRINWGVAGGHIPYRSVAIFSGLDTVTVNGDTVIARTQELIRERVYEDQVMLMADYPLSTNRRFEASASFTRLSFDAESERITYIGNTIIDESEQDLEAREGLNLAQAALAYVGDYSYFGFTSPISGRRFRLEAEPTFGSLDFLTVLADYRHYFFANPVTIAFRGLHYGRYLGDSESDRLSQLYLGGETLVRGYSVGSIEVSECTEADRPGACPEYDRLVGSRLGVFNAELRFPLFGTDQYGLVNFSYLPTELLAFFDTGVAWTKTDSPELKWAEKSEDRVPVFSAGVATRVNLFGYIVGQVYLAFPFQRPAQTTSWGFLISPGW